MVDERKQTANALQVACGERHTCCLDHLGNVICFGRNREGQCGVPEAGDAAYVPVLVSALAHVRIVRVSCSGSHTLAVAGTDEHRGWCVCVCVVGMAGEERR